MTSFDMGLHQAGDAAENLYCWRLLRIIMIFLILPGSEDSVKIKSKLEWLRVDVILNWESLVKED